MARRALVIGSQTYDLKGVVSDARGLSSVLQARGFEVDLRVGQDATREGILEGYHRLIRSCSAGDCAVVYFSGHGGRVRDPEYRPDGRPRLSSHEQFIVPEDFQFSREGDFRGITALELSALQARLTALTREVTVILDCCFAACMSRASGIRAKALSDTPYGWIAAHLESLRERGVAPASLHVEGNPHAVRMVASGVDETAFEYLTARGVWVGAMTDALLAALDEAGQLPVSWELLGRRVRERVISMFPFQRPELEGPVQRIALALGEVASSPGLPYFGREGRHFLRGGRLHGVNVGDEYLVMPFPASRADPAHGLARASVIHVDTGSCEVRLETSNRTLELTPGSPAFLVRAAGRKRSVQVIDDGAEGSLAGALRIRLEASGLVRPAPEGGGEPSLATVSLGTSFIEVRDRDGCRVAYPLQAEPGAVGQVVHGLETLARAQALRELESGPGADTLEDRMCVEWGVVEGSKSRRLSGERRLLEPGERVYVRLVNDGPERLFASVFDIGVGGRITLLNRSQPSGMLIEPGGDGWVGMRCGQDLVGIELRWPDAVPADAPGLESLVVIISDRPQDLRLLETGGLRPRASSPRSQLQSLLELIAWGGGRDLRPLEEDSPVRYMVRHLEFMLQCPTRPVPA
ncbi:caspase family protein [Archangium violaceum]|uniref:caspase family protein n=1 Tax=Archangium violaceum TaxID=83451 RepID=UPI0036DD7794